MNAIALCAVGAEKVVSNELRKLNLSVADSGFGRVRFKAEVEGLYRALVGLRAADRVLLEMAFFPAEDFDDLFEGVRKVPWEDFVPAEMGLAVTKVRSSRSCLSALTSIQAVTHKAAAERLCEKRGINRLPEGGYGNSGVGNLQAEIRVYIDKDKVSLLLDLSGEPLFKRGYRLDGGIAPLRETTAAAIILLSLWKRKFPLWDPFCGSGTIAIEADLYAWDMAPCLGRTFAIENLLIADAVLERRIREEFLAKVDFSRPLQISGSDTDGRALNAARANLERAYQIARGIKPEGKKMTGERFAGHLPGLAEFMNVPMEEARPQGSEKGFIITNPPYGRRLGNPEDAEKIYTDMGKLERNFSGWKLGVITDHPGFESFFGKRADSCREITNGAVHSFFYQYDVI